MAIGRDEIFAAADVLKAKGVKVSNDSLKAELLKEYGSGGNRNLLCECFREWREINGVKTNNTKPANASPPPATTKAVKPVQTDTNDSIISKLPEQVRNAVITLVAAILTYINKIRAQERDAATVLVEHERDEARQQVVELENEVTRLSEDNERLEAALAAKQETVSVDILLATFAKLIAANAPTINLVTTPPEQPITATISPEPAIASKPSRTINQKSS